MSHEIETMAYANEVPWHGLGTKVDDCLEPIDMMKAAGLDWTVSQHPVIAMVDGEEIAVNKQALIRDTDKKVLTVTSERWQPTQNIDAFKFFKEFCDAGGISMETAGSIRGGQHVWALARLNSGFSIGGDETKGYLLFSLPHEIGKSIQIRTTSVRVVCNNTLTYSLGQAAGVEYRQTHQRVFDFDKAKQIVELSNQNLAKQGEFCKKLSSVSMDKFDALAFFSDILTDEALSRAEAEGLMDEFDKPSFQRSRLGQMMNSYINGPGADAATAYGVLNGITHWCDHASGIDQSKRLWDSWFGSNFQLKSKALKKLQELAD